MQKLIFTLLQICLLLICCLKSSQIWSQKPEPISYVTIVPKVAVDKSTWCVVEEYAAFPGGLAAWIKYLSDSTRYPDIFSINQRENVVRIQFIISREGLTTEIKTLDSTANYFTEEAIRIIKNSPRWLPAKQNGRPVSSRMIQGFNFLWHPPTLTRISA